MQIGNSQPLFALMKKRESAVQEHIICYKHPAGRYKWHDQTPDSSKIIPCAMLLQSVLGR
jgi:hypothetical protein